MDLPRFKLRAAAVHAAPVYMDKEKTTAKVVRIIEDAGKQGLELLVFPETFIPGYPVLYVRFAHSFRNFKPISNLPEITLSHQPKTQYFIEAYPPMAHYAQQSVVCTAADPSIRAIQAACRTTGVTISLGVSERMGFTLFNAQLHIEGASGALLGVHRKLQPTFAERYVWAQGDGASLKVWPVAGARYNLGGLCCWEHTMNGERQALIEQGQHVHAAA